VSCFVKDTAAGHQDQSGTGYSLRASGLDHPGIVEAVTDVLAQRKVNVTSFSSWLENAPLTGTPVFHLEAEIHLPSGTDPSGLRASLYETCEREGVEFQLDELDL
jgi:glycine cleavage system transcriptional repressor